MADVIVAPGLGAAWAAEPAGRNWLTIESMLATDDFDPGRLTPDSAPLSYLYTSGTTSLIMDEAALLAAVKQRLDGFKVPKAVIVAGALPKTSTGKIQKNAIRSEHAQHYGG